MILNNLGGAGPLPPFLPSLVVIAAVLLVRYIVSVLAYRGARKSHNDASTEGQLPPSYPALLPYLGNAVSFAWNTGALIRRATSFEGRLTSTRLPIMGTDMYVFQDRETIAKIMRHPNLASPMSLYNFGQRYFFGMPEEGVAVYAADDSGPSQKPFPESRTPPTGRIDYLLHRAFHSAWSGPRLASASRRFTGLLEAQVASLPVPADGSWLEVDDLFKFLGLGISSALTQTIFGPSLLALNPDIIENIWSFDDTLPWLVRRVPAWLMPGPYRVRQTIRAQIRRWYAYARTWYSEASVDGDGDGDPFWGCEFVRHLQREMLKTGDGKGFIDDESFSAHDLGMLWGTNSNTISAAMLSTIHMFRDPAALSRVRAELRSEFPDKFTTEDEQNSFSLEGLDLKHLSRLTLLSSLYAETMRLYVEVLLMYSSPHNDVSVGSWLLPRGRIGLVNTNVSHRDETVWNTRGGQFPLSGFWADRFVVDPADPLSGPVRPEARGAAAGGKMQEETTGPEEGVAGRDKPYFSTEGLAGSWIPYGGGPTVCPGRFLAKTVIMSTCALLATKFDVEILTDSIECDAMRFGLGVARPKRAIPARIRRRRI